MKKFLALASAVLISGSALAQVGSNTHMFEFNADSVLRGVFSFDKSKSRAKDADNDTELDLNLNYAYALPMMPRLQIGGRVNYLKDTSSAGDVENYGLMVGAILNHSADLQNSMYASLYAGLGWNNNYAKGANDDELLTSVLAVGKRFSMERWNIKHLTYTPELALRSENSTTGGSLEYSQSLELRVLQFSVFF